MPLLWARKLPVESRDLPGVTWKQPGVTGHRLEDVISDGIHPRPHCRLRGVEIAGGLILVVEVYPSLGRDLTSRYWEKEPGMKLAERIEINPDVMLGKPVIKGTRIPVELILRRISEGATEEALIASYPHLTRDDIRAAVAFAADTIANDEIIETATHSG